MNLVFWGFNQQIADQAKAFNATHPAIQVTALQQPSGADQYYPKVLNAVKAGNAPDVALVEYQYIANFTSQNGLVDLAKYGANDVKSQFDANAWSQVVQGNSVYGYPQDTGPMGLFYNKAALAKAGITTPPATWDEFAADAVKFHAQGPDYYLTAFGPQNTGWYQALNWQAGAIWFSIDTAAKAWKININSAQSKKVATFWQDLIDKGLVTTTATDFTNDWNAALDSGKIATWPSAVWGQGVITGSAKDTKGQWAVASLPQWTPGANASAFWGGSGISVIAGTKHPQAAETFVRWYLTNADSLTIGVRDIGWFPSNIAARQYPQVTGPSDFYSGQVVDSVFTAATLKVDPTWTFPPDLTVVNQKQGDAFNNAIANKTKLTDALDTLQKAVVDDLKSQGITVAGQ